jgi:hypothetical protein
MTATCEGTALLNAQALGRLQVLKEIAELDFETYEGVMRDE